MRRRIAGASGFVNGWRGQAFATRDPLVALIAFRAANPDSQMSQLQPFGDQGIASALKAAATTDTSAALTTKTLFEHDK